MDFLDSLTSRLSRDDPGLICQCGCEHFRRITKYHMNGVEMENSTDNNPFRVECAACLIQYQLNHENKFERVIP